MIVGNDAPGVYEKYDYDLVQGDFEDRDRSERPYDISFFGGQNANVTKGIFDEE